MRKSPPPNRILLLYSKNALTNKEAYIRISSKKERRASSREKNHERSRKRNNGHRHSGRHYNNWSDDEQQARQHGHHVASRPSVPSCIFSVILRIAFAVKRAVLFLFDVALNALRSAASHPIGRLLLLIAAVILVALLIVVGIHVVSQDPASEPATNEETTSDTTSKQYQPNTGDLASLQLASSDFTAFTLNQNRSDVIPKISDDKLAAISSATQALTSHGYSVGYIFINLNTGMGIAQNIDTSVYAASSIKGPYAAYLCSLLDQGTLSRNTQCPNTWVLDSNSTRDQSSYSVESLIHDMIVESDNDALRFLRSSYDSYGFEQYLANIQADTSIAREEGSFAHYTARDSAIMWMNIYQYLIQAESNENAAWLAELMASTNLSFIRNATENQHMDTVVYNKGGWCVDSDSDDYNSVCDSAIVFESGTPYLLTIMTSAPDGSNNEEAVTNIASALLDTRYSLDDVLAGAMSAKEGAESILSQGIKGIGLSLSIATE